MIVLTNARVFRTGTVETGSVAIDGDQVIAVGPDVTVDGGSRYDVGGAWVGPGFVDLHVHFRDPGQTWKEDLSTGAAAAKAGGYTAVIVMPNTDPAIDDGEKLGSVLRRAREVGGLDIGCAGAMTRARAGGEMADLDGMYEAGARLFTDDGDSVADAGLIRAIMRYLADFPGALVAEHPEEANLSRGGHLHEGEVSARLGVSGMPALAEELVVGRDIQIAAETGARLHLQHVSTARAVDMVRQAKRSGIGVTAEVTPHHLTLDQDALRELDPNMKMYPPLRSAEDRAALVEALRDGTIDVVATDHAPHAPEEKAVPFEQAPRGVTGLETSAPVTLSVLDGDPSTLFERMSVAPARVAGLARHGRWVEPGAPANLVVFDPSRRWTPERFASKASNSPFVGRELTGKVLATIHEGQLSYDGGLS